MDNVEKEIASNKYKRTNKIYAFCTSIIFIGFIFPVSIYLIVLPVIVMLCVYLFKKVHRKFNPPKKIKEVAKNSNDFNNVCPEEKS